METATKETNRHYSPPQVARIIGCNAGKVGNWINGGEIEAYNAAASPNGKPRWRVTHEALERFIRRRSNTTYQRPAVTRSRRVPAVEQIV